MLVFPSPSVSARCSLGCGATTCQPDSVRIRQTWAPKSEREKTLKVKGKQDRDKPTGWVGGCVCKRERERMKRRENEIQIQRPIYSPLRRDSICPKPLPGSLSTSCARKEEHSRVSAGDTGEETSSSPGRAPPPTRSNAAGLLALPGASLSLEHPGPLAPPRARPARTWGPAARGGAERTVQGQQAGQQRAEPSHVAARGRGPEGARAPGSGLPERLERDPDCRTPASRPPPAPPPPPARPLRAPRATAWTAGSARPRLPAGERSGRCASAPRANCREPVGPPAP